MLWVTAESFGSVDRLVAQPHPVATAQFKALGRADARLLLRYQVAEQNRWYFQTWETAQIVIGMLFFFFLLFLTRENKFALLLVLLMIAAVVVQRFLLTPGMISLGRMIDYAPPNAFPGERAAFWVLHGWYWGMELAKWALGLVLAARLITHRGGRSGYARQKVDMIDKAYYRHVDGL
jgi:predicted lysophospholipase L1 biosynthesis ABC-type transport system permease subunit